MATGKVKWFDTKKGFGFIVPDDPMVQENIFVHYSAIIGDKFRTLNEGDLCEFQVKETNRGPQAEHVRVLTRVYLDHPPLKRFHD